MNDLEIKNKIIKIFEKIRSNPSTTFEEDNFMNFLINPPCRNNEIKNSFKGTRKYYDFMGQIELEFSICFSYDELDKSYSIEKLTSLIKKRISKHKGNVSRIQARKGEKNNYFLKIILTIILVGLIVMFNLSWITITYVTIYLIIMVWMISSQIRDKKHTNLLYNKIIDSNRKL